MIAQPVSITLFCLLLLISNTSVHSETLKPERSDTVATRLHPELEPFGLPVGSFIMYTKLGYMLSYDDNIFANDEFQESDVITDISPAVELVSDWSRHLVNLSASADLGRYRDFSTEDYDDWRVAGNVQIDASHVSRFNLGAVYANLHEPRESPDSVNVLSPGIFTSSLVTLGLTYRPGTFSITPTASYQSLEYEDIDSLVLGVPVTIKQDDRNRKEYILGLRVAYEVGPDRNAFLRVRSFITDYDKLQQVTNFDRSSDGYEVAMGVALDFGGITRGQFFIGYRKQEYIDPLPDISVPIFGIDMVWKPTELTSVEFNANRDIGETIVFAYSGYVITSASINVDHELRRNIVLNANLSKNILDFAGIGSATRKDENLASSVGIKWRHSRNIAVNLRHEYTTRDSSDSIIPAGFPEDDFHRNVSWISIELQQ